MVYLKLMLYHLLYNLKLMFEKQIVGVLVLLLGIGSKSVH